jgi:hypothetical protein
MEGRLRKWRLKPSLHLEGKRFGRWTVLRESPSLDAGGKIRWVCKCDCGIERAVREYYLVKGLSRSCSCLGREETSKRTRTHGLTGTHEYWIWAAMKDRILNPKNSHYHLYGGRGITVSTEWLSFAAFYRDMGQRPSSRHTIERIDNSKGYSKENCKWATYFEQARNMRKNVWLELNGKRMIVAEWARELKMSDKVLQARLSRGWTVVDALTLPLLHGGRNRAQFARMASLPPSKPKGEKVKAATNE